MRVAELSTNFDGGQVGTEMITLGDRARGLKVQLRSHPGLDLHAAQGKSRLVRVRFGETGGGPLREVQALCIRQVKLARTASQVRAERCSMGTYTANLARTGR